MQPSGDGLALCGAGGWLQGRTMYGGASSFLAYSAARILLPDLPTLRGAQVTFIAPVSDTLRAQARVLRRLHYALAPRGCLLLAMNDVNRRTHRQ